MAPPKTLFQQFKDLETIFLGECSYQNTGPSDQNELVARFFVNAYVLREMAVNKDDIVGRFRIDKGMRKYELQYYTMLGGDEGINTAKKGAQAIAAFFAGLEESEDGIQAAATNRPYFPN